MDRFMDILDVLKIHQYGKSIGVKEMEWVVEPTTICGYRMDTNKHMQWYICLSRNAAFIFDVRHLNVEKVGI
jgi:hypothetical protein